MNIPIRLRGFTLIELLVTLAVAAILMTVAVPGMQALLANQRLSSSASNFMTTVMQARSAALKYNQRVIAEPFGAVGEWRVYVDASENSTFDSGTDTLVVTQEPLPDGISITKVTGTNNFLGYDGSGFLASIGGSANSTWLVSSTATTRKKYLVIERSGRAYLCDPSIVGAASCPPT